MEVSDAIANRRSIRKYTGEEVSDNDIKAVLEAGRWGPSGLNNQPWKFKVLKGKVKDSIAEHTRYGHIIEAAPACIAVFLDVENSYNRDKDLQAIGACIQNMLLRIQSLGLGAVWLGEILNQREKVEETLGVEHELMAVIALGHPGEEGSSDRKDMGELLLE
ncbi:MAG: nitroreductase family protein [Candidatus Altiarchaeales archaeon]|nr:nitroreductase family protein [Candidatus Altiarchaeales archaeon]MBD3416955.1 nitroreductase family protein [Candidatus Altiarchaeales archaeon]